MRSLISINFPAPEMEPESRRFRKKAQDAQDAVLRFLKFSVSVALTRCLSFFCPMGTREGSRSRWPPRPGHHPPESSQNFCPDLFPSPCQGTKCPSCCMRYRGGPHMRSLISIDFPAPKLEPESAHVVSAVSVHWLQHM